MNSSRLESEARRTKCDDASPVLRGGHHPPPAPLKKGRGGRGGSSGAQADMPSAETSGAICVQTFDDSRNSAIHTTYRISLRSSSLREPRYPLLRVVFCLSKNRADVATVFIRSENEGLNRGCMVWVIEVALQPRPARERAEPKGRRSSGPTPDPSRKRKIRRRGIAPLRPSDVARVPGSAREHKDALRASTHLPMRPLKGTYKRFAG